MSLDPERYLDIQFKIQLLADVVADWELDEVLTLITRAQAVGPILDPTLYKNKIGDLNRYELLVRALKPFYDVVKLLKEPATAATQ